jgi:tRNA(Arg) A34 adenosine deaminase TadA
MKDDDRHPQLETYFMKQALKVAREALAIGEVPVGCVIVLRKDLDSDLDSEDVKKMTHDRNSDNGGGGDGDGDVVKEVHTQGHQDTEENNKEDENIQNDMNSNSNSNSNSNNGNNNNNNEEEIYNSSSQVIVSHGANQVNATRDATRHAECIAIDRMITGGLVSDKMRLPPHVFLKKMKKKKTETTSTASTESTTSIPENTNDHDKWTNVPSDPNHWKNAFGWGSGKLYKRDIFKKCDLYVTCEPCIMVSNFDSIHSTFIISYIFILFSHDYHYTTLPSPPNEYNSFILHSVLQPWQELV